MRIVGGSLRGRRLAAPDGGAVRPTSDRAREALFNRMDHGAFSDDGTSSAAGAFVLDAFCGTGALGLEALSRGAAQAVFIDNDDDAIACVRTNIAALGVADRATVLRADATDPPRAAAPCTLIFLDPPYAGNTIAAALPALAAAGWLAPGALCVAESAAKSPAPEPPAGFETLDSRSYGRARFCFLRFRP
ncbi:MAG: 16S rRNA (guanine(966)-N(2))-methyltransferase RsmD [Rhodospirillaceae bacterium]|nr:16S rRNA (guanine(966)-N(2))-methyltransferase RsmD [Rhodospirillaceae bacterium]